mmetsp:Transcript_100226/g.283805  ORF Transcript_100226/g.283805 Transcript_100226/m.283805 type:complete len:336 (-) Transcript_100226:72-1079(-)
MSRPAGDDQALSKSGRGFFMAAVFAHGSARLLSKVASAPLDRLKVCLQVSERPRDGGQGPWRLGRASGRFREILRTQGARSLWRGCATHIAGASLGGIARLGLLRTSQMWVMPGIDSQYEGFSAYWRRCSFLYAAGAAALLLAYPFDVAYTCLAADAGSPPHFRGVAHLVRATCREHGVLSLYRGFPLCLGTAVPFVATATAVHDALAPRLLQRMGQAPKVDSRDVQPKDLVWLVREGAPAHLYPWNLVVGAASGLAAQAVTYPLDTLRRKWQHTCAAPRVEAPATLRECARGVHERGGWRAFYAGFGVNALKLVPELAALCGVYSLLNASGNFL